MLVNVVGLGYIGLPTALMMADSGIQVVGTDKDAERVKMLQNSQLVFEEEGISELFFNAAEKGIIFSTDYVAADIYILAVPTPFNKRSKKVVADYLVNAVEAVVKVCGDNSVIVIESTISPGTIDKFVRPIVDCINRQKGYQIELAHAPERIIPGRMIEELRNNNRTIGADSVEVAERIKSIYAGFCHGQIVLTDIKTAEMSKVVENAYRDVNIAYANELVKICKEACIDVYEIIKIANMHPRVNILKPGPGVGGHCISVDPWFLVGDYPGLSNIILAARKINDSMPEYVLDRISVIMEENGITELGRVGIYGLTYKENVDDVRESPTLQLLNCMRKHLAWGIKVYDPYVKNIIVKNQYMDFESFLSEIDLLVVMVGHKHLVNNESMLKDKLVFDTKNVLTELDTYKL
ncbi:nucleotide sugar dehydrogenase [Acetatifactor aquisgranensis]|uniref:nucleotide sugar dehydrogenase n=1 Tax=Acetatifactor aquisgranensis TaxID=2941233 RepID=UPI002ED5EF51